jgi:hypothetical protein
MMDHHVRWLVIEVVVSVLLQIMHMWRTRHRRRVTRYRHVKFGALEITRFDDEQDTSH